MSFTSSVRKTGGSLSGDNVRLALSPIKDQMIPQSREGHVPTDHVHCRRKVSTIENLLYFVLRIPSTLLDNQHLLPCEFCGQQFEEASLMWHQSQCPLQEVTI